MWRCACRRGERVAAGLVLCVALGLVTRPVAARAPLTAPAAPVDTAPERIELMGLRLNGVDAGGIVAVRRLGSDGHQLALDIATWSALGLRRVDTGEWQPLAAAGVAARVDESTQTLHLEAPASAFVGGRVAREPAPLPRWPSGRGGFLNYELHSQPAQGLQPRRSAGWLEFSGFGPAGALRHTALVTQTGRAAGASGHTRTRRLETTWIHEDPAQRQTLELGDTVSQPGGWGRALRFGGLSWRSDFSLDPGFVRHPTPTLQGEVLQPSTIELYVDGLRRSVHGVPAGPFEIGVPEAAAGSGEMRLVLRDLLGREQVLVLPYHSHVALLRPGLAAWSLDLGLERLDYGWRSGHYGDPLAVLTRREGLHERWTQEWRAELTRSQRTLGTGAVHLLPDGSTLQGQFAVSHRSNAPAGEATLGTMLSLQAERQHNGHGAALQWRQHSASFRQLGQPDSAAPRWQLLANLGTRWAGWGLGLTLAGEQPRDSPRRLWSSSRLSRQLGDLGQLSFTLRRDHDAGAYAATVHLHLPLGRQQSASMGRTRRSSGQPGGGHETVDTLGWQTTPAEHSGLGARLVAERAHSEPPGAGSTLTSTRQGAELLWQGDQLAVDLAVTTGPGGTQARLAARGAIGVVDGHGFASRRIDGSVAVVRLDGLPGVGIRLDHRRVARTDAEGRAVLTGLRPHELQRIEVEAEELPAEVEARNLALELVPPGRAGITVKLGVERGRSLRLVLRRADGRLPMAGSRIEIDGREPQPGDVVGFDGRGYLARLGVGTRLSLRVHEPDGSQCRLQLELPPGPGDTELGEQTCH